MHRPGVELATSRSQVRRRTTTLPSHPSRPMYNVAQSAGVGRPCDGRSTAAWSVQLSFEEELNEVDGLLYQRAVAVISPSVQHTFIQHPLPQLTFPPLPTHLPLPAASVYLTTRVSLQAGIAPKCRPVGARLYHVDGRIGIEIARRTAITAMFYDMRSFDVI